MARKKITSLLGNDPVYSKQFGDRTTPAPVPDVPPEKEQAKKQPAAASVRVLKKSDKVAPPKPHTPKPKTIKKPKTRAVHVRAVPKKEHGRGLDALDAAGLPSSDVVRLAGKRAIEKFELKSKYVAPQEVERLPSSMSFRTMKTLDATILDKLRDQADPLRLRSDAAVVLGQLEPLFWSELTSLIKELRKKYG